MDKWRWLVLWSFIGAFTKETSVPIYVAFASGWWLASPSRHGLAWSKAFWILAMATIGFAALIVLMFHVSPYLPWSFAVSQRSADAYRYFYLTSGFRCLFNHEVLYVFAWLLPLGLSKEIYAGTTSLFFTVGNATKAVPWLLLVRPTGNVWTLMAICLLAIPAGVWLGWRLHGRLDQRQLYRIVYALLIVTALKLLWDGVSGYLG